MRRIVNNFKILGRKYERNLKPYQFVPIQPPGKSFSADGASNTIISGFMGTGIRHVNLEVYLIKDVDFIAAETVKIAKSEPDIALSTKPTANEVEKSPSRKKNPINISFIPVDLIEDEV